MKKTTRVLPVIILGLSLLVTGCKGPANEGTPETPTVNTAQEEEKNKVKNNRDNTAANAEKTEKDEGANEGTTEKDAEKKTTEEEEEEKNPKEVTPTTEPKSKGEVYNMMADSDYISRVKLIRLGNDQKELKILENYKGSLSNIEFNVPNGLKTDKEYLVFYKDDTDGTLIPTAGNDSFIEVAPTNDTILDYVAKTYGKDEESKEKKAAEEKGSSSKDQEKTKDASKKSDSSKDKE